MKRFILATALILYGWVSADGQSVNPKLTRADVERLDRADHCHALIQGAQPAQLRQLGQMATCPAWQAYATPERHRAAILEYRDLIIKAYPSPDSPVRKELAEAEGRASTKSTSPRRRQPLWVYNELEMNWKALIHSITAAAVTGAATGGLTALQGGNTKQSGTAAIAGAIAAVLALLKSSPLVQPPTPPPSKEPVGPVQAIKEVLHETAGPTEKP